MFSNGNPAAPTSVFAGSQQRPWMQLPQQHFQRAQQQQAATPNGNFVTIMQPVAYAVPFHQAPNRQTLPSSLFLSRGISSPPGGPQFRLPQSATVQSMPETTPPGYGIRALPSHHLPAFLRSTMGSIPMPHGAKLLPRNLPLDAISFVKPVDPRMAAPETESGEVNDQPSISPALKKIKLAGDIDQSATVSSSIPKKPVTKQVARPSKVDGRRKPMEEKGKPTTEGLPSSLQGDRRLVIDFESFGHKGKYPQRFGKSGLLIPDGLIGQHTVYQERWRFEIHHSNEPLPDVDYMCITWKITNMRTGHTHSRTETPEEAEARVSLGWTISSKLFRDAMAFRANQLETILEGETNECRIANLKSLIKTLRPKTFTQGPLIFGLKHKVVQEKIGNFEILQADASTSQAPTSPAASSSSGSPAEAEPAVASATSTQPQACT